MYSGYYYSKVVNLHICVGLAALKSLSSKSENVKFLKESWGWISMTAIGADYLANNSAVLNFVWTFRSQTTKTDDKFASKSTKDNFYTLVLTF